MTRSSAVVLVNAATKGIRSGRGFEFSKHLLKICVGDFQFIVEIQERVFLDGPRDLIIQTADLFYVHGDRPEIADDKSYLTPFGQDRLQQDDRKEMVLQQQLETTVYAPCEIN